jgi:hypothetical protein
MIVSELIERLKSFPANGEVWTSADDATFPASEVHTEEVWSMGKLVRTLVFIG